MFNLLILNRVTDARFCNKISPTSYPLSRGKNFIPCRLKFIQFATPSCVFITNHK